MWYIFFAAWRLFNLSQRRSRVTDSRSHFALSAMLLMDEPNTSSAVQHPVLNCGQAGALDDSAEGPGVCSIISSGDPATTYDGNPGHPNAFQGQVADSVNFTSIQFVGVPVDPPGTGSLRFFRFTNLRANAAAFTGCSMTNLCPIVATISVKFQGSPDPFV